jgi:prepilin-type N-terminal cleavage/methylation domain-containing protein
MRIKTGQSGFTLVDLMVVIAVIGILLAIAVPNFLSWQPNMRLRSAARDIFSVMSRAKIEAIKRHANVTIRFNAQGDVNYPPNTFIMFLDNVGAGGTANDEIQNGTEPILLALTALPANVQYGTADLNGDGDFTDPGEVNDVDGVTFGNDHVLVFNSRGIPINTFLPSALYMGTIGLRSVDGNGNVLNMRSVSVSSAGRINVQ